METAMFNLTGFIKKGFLEAIGEIGMSGAMSEAQIRLSAAGWYQKGVLTEDDMVEINKALAERVSLV